MNPHPANPAPDADAPAARPARAAVSSAASAVTRFTVLLGNEADAAEAWHRTASGLLAAQGVRTLVARTGREALGLIEDGALGRGPRIHLAVLDQRMPVMGGLQILRRLQLDLAELQKRAAATAAPPPESPAPASPGRSGRLGGAQTVPPVPPVPPAILLADTVASGVMHEALSMRVFSVLPKPIELNLLLDTLARALRRYYQDKWPQRGEDV